MKKNQNKEKLQVQQKKLKQWGQLLKNVDQMYKKDHSELQMKKQIRKQILKGVLDFQQQLQNKQKNDLQNLQKNEEMKMIQGWKNQNKANDLIQLQRYKKIKQTSLSNKKQANKILQKTINNRMSPIVSQYGVNEIYESQYRKQKQAQQYMKNIYENQVAMKQRQKKMNSQKQRKQYEQKIKQLDQMQSRRQKQLQKIKNEHIQNMDVYKKTEDILSKSTKFQSNKFDSGIIQQNNINQFQIQIKKHQLNKQLYNKSLRQQLQYNKLRSLQKSTIQKQQDKQMVKHKIDQFNKQKQLQTNRRYQSKHILANSLNKQQKQKRQRQILQSTMDQYQKINHNRQLNLHQSDNIIPVLHNSPFHIGQYAYSDRKKQLNLIQKNLQDSLDTFNIINLNKSINIGSLKNNNQLDKQQQQKNQNHTKQVKYVKQNLSTNKDFQYAYQNNHVSRKKQNIQQIKIHNKISNPQAQSSLSFRSNRSQSLQKSQLIFQKASFNILGSSIQ